MPVPTALSDLSTTANSNYPAGSENPTVVDDHLRAHAALIATLRDGKGASAEVDVASAATCDIGGANSPFARITGTTTITSFGTNYNGPRFLRFADALTLTHNASTLILPGSANIATTAGDSCVAIPISGGWRVLAYTSTADSTSRRLAGFTSAVIDRSFGSYATNTDLTTQIPGDDTVPQNTEGTEIISLSFTPKSVSNRLRVRFQGEFGLSSGGSGAAAIFASSAGASAIAATATTVSSSGLFAPLAAESEFVPGTTSAVTISVRVGPTSAVTMRMNGNTSGRLFGGVSKATLVVEEIAA